LTPITAGHLIVGASSDYLVVDVTRAAEVVRVGDELAFAPDYGALVTAVGAPGMATRIVGAGEPA